MFGTVKSVKSGMTSQWLEFWIMPLKEKKRKRERNLPSHVTVVNWCGLESGVQILLNRSLWGPSQGQQWNILHDRKWAWHLPVYILPICLQFKLPYQYMPLTRAFLKHCGNSPASSSFESRIWSDHFQPSHLESLQIEGEASQVPPSQPRSLSIESKQDSMWNR